MAEIISIGDELLIGQVINTNQAYIAEQFNSVGIGIRRMTTVGDDESEILAAFERALASVDIVTVTGGLGPTHDDITRAAVCKFFGTDLVRDERALAHIKQLFQQRNIPLIKLNEDQALVPRSCTVIDNEQGTAPGYFFDRSGRYFFVMPGVPFEMKSMMQSFVVPFFERRQSGCVIRHRTLKTTGIAESLLAHQIGNVDELFAPESGVTLAFLPAPIGTRMRITVRSHSIAETNRLIAEVEAQLRSKAGKYIYAADDDELEHTLGRLLLERKLKISIAESCTGGLVADRLTNVAGSSAYFDRGVVAYSNESKTADLGVPTEILKTRGAVSRETAEAMAFGVRTRSNADIGISTTGIAGPSGATADKPIGLVWIGYSDRNETLALKFNFGSDRRRTKERAAQAAMELVRRKVLKID